MNSISGHLAQIRQDYQKATLNEAQAGDDPVSFFKKWLNEAEAAAATEVNAMTLATVDVHGDPDARIVLLKGIDDKDNFIFIPIMKAIKERNWQPALRRPWSSSGRNWNGRCG